MRLSFSSLVSFFNNEHCKIQPGEAHTPQTPKKYTRFQKGGGRKKRHIQQHFHSQNTRDTAATKEKNRWEELVLQPIQFSDQGKVIRRILWRGQGSVLR